MIHFRVLAISEMDRQAVLRRTRFFGVVEKTFLFAVCKEKMVVHCSVRSVASRTVACREV